MRTTLTLDDDVVAAAKAIGERNGKTIGQVISELARRSLQPQGKASTRNGIPLLAPSETGKIITPELVNALRDEDP